MNNTRYVKKASGKGWDVIKEGHRQATAHRSTKAAAIRRARELALLEGGGEVEVLDRAGKTVDAATVKASRPRAA
jgi:Uncharacterized protein conserved in bacteria (DUF2188)